MSEIAGSRVKVRFRGQILSVKRVNVRDSITKGDITSSESLADDKGVVRTEVLSQTGTCTVTITNATYDPAENWFNAPRGMATGQSGELQVFPDGLTSGPWLFPNFLVTDGTHDFDVDTLQPVSITGVNSGLYFQPDTAP